MVKKIRTFFEDEIRCYNNKECMEKKRLSGLCKFSSKIRGKLFGGEK